MSDEKITEIEGLPVQAAGDITPEMLFEIDQNMAQGQDFLDGLTMLLAETLTEYRGEKQDWEAHPGRHLAPQDFLTHLARLDEGQAKGLLQMACWALAEQWVDRAQQHVMLSQMLGHDADIPCTCDNCTDPRNPGHEQ